MERSHLISVAELAKALVDSKINIIDCRFDLMNPDSGLTSYRRAHIPGAVYAHLDDDLAAPVGPQTGRHPLPDPALLAERLGNKGISNASSVVVYDGGNGAMAARAWWLLRWLGHDSVKLLDGGYAAWINAGHDVAEGDESPSPATFVPRPRQDIVVSTEELIACGGDVAALNLFDARDAARFRGEVEPIDPVAGHIPGARNQPLGESIGPDGLWKSREALEELWERALGDHKSVEWAVMCGSGVTACHIALSGMEAGYREPRVYVGSWSEWIRDPSRPVARGEQ